MDSYLRFAGTKVGRIRKSQLIGEKCLDKKSDKENTNPADKPDRGNLN